MNNSLIQLGRQLQTIWKQLGLKHQVSVVLAAGAVLIGLLSLAFWSSRADYALLYGRLEEAEAAKVVSALDDAKIPYKVSRGGGTISIPSDKVGVMRMQLAAKGIPRAGDGVGWEIFDKPNFGISDFVQHANYLRAVQGELARTISQVDSIESARVMVVMPENRLLVEGNRHPTASVFVRVKSNATLPVQTVNAIRFLVANAVEGLQAGSVTVVDNLGNVLSENIENDSMAGMTTTQLGARKNMETYLSKKAEGMLDKVLGPGQSVVRVSAEINYDTTTKTEEKFDPDGAVLRSSTINDENTDALTSNSTGGVPGVQTDASSDTNNAAAVPTNKNITKKKVTTTQYEVSNSTSKLMQSAGNLKRLSAAVFVAARFTGTGTNRVSTPRTPEELLKLKHIVESALGIQEGTDAAHPDEITLEEMPFNDQPGMELTQQLDKDQKREFWTNLAGNLVYPALALGMLAFFYRAFKKTPNENIPIGIPLNEMVATANGNGNGNGHSNGHGNGNGHPLMPAMLLKSRGQGLVTVDVLNQLIRENPNNMTQAIRTWMNRAKSK